MHRSKTILAIDQGTTSSRALLFEADGRIGNIAQREFKQIYPEQGWVEHDPEEIWTTSVDVCRQAIHQSGRTPAAIGITNQRETTLVWDRGSGRPVYNAIVWQDRRTAEHCARLKGENLEPLIREKTGLLLDPYFSATKIAWILDNIDGARARARAGELAFGTIDCFLVWRLTGGAVHACDVTNASRTLLYNINTLEWDEELLELFDIPLSLLPEVKQCADDYGSTEKSILGASIGVCGVAGDQQAATIGQACFERGMVKSTYGTGCFAVLNTGPEPVLSDNRLLTTIAYGIEGKTTYALEGSIFVAGAAVQWLRDGIGVIDSAADTQALAEGLEDNAGVYLVPAFTGLGAPHWDPYARAALFGMTRDTGPAELARAALESVAYQTCDLVAAMRSDGAGPASIRVDGGMVVNDWLCRFLADTVDVQVQRPEVIETTAQGAAFLAALQIGELGSLDDIATRWLEGAHFHPSMSSERRQYLLNQWHRAVAATRGFSKDR